MNFRDLAFIVAAAALLGTPAPSVAQSNHGASYLTEKKQVPQSRPSRSGGSSATRGGLAGSEGQVRRKVIFGKWGKNDCREYHKRYIAASGHSAYASTPMHYRGETSVCGANYNSGSKSQAEQRALEACQRGIKKFKLRFGVEGRCEIMASK